MGNSHLEPVFKLGITRIRKQTLRKKYSTDTLKEYLNEEFFAIFD